MSRFRGLIASASLKLRNRLAMASHVVGFRGLIASASLKHAARPGDHVEAAVIPRLDCLGLIEASAVLS